MLEPGRDKQVSTRRVTVVLGGDDIEARTGVRFGLERHGFSVVAEANDADEAVEAARLHRPQVCLLDVDMPGGGIDAADRIYAELPGTKIAMLSGSTPRDGVREAILAGADGYLLRSTAPDRLTAALNGLINGEAALPRALTGELVHELRQIERWLDQISNGDSPDEGVAPPWADETNGTPGPHQAPAPHAATRPHAPAGSHEIPGPHEIPVPDGIRGEDRQSGAISWNLLYMPRLLSHFRRRRRSGMSVADAWSSARERIRAYR